MDMLTILLLCVVLITETVSHLALKTVSTHHAARAPAMSVLHEVRKYTRQPLFWIALVSFAIGFFAWIGFLARVPLGQGVMAGSLTIVSVMIGGRVLYGEKLTRSRCIAIVLIAIGVTLVGLGRT